jgi:hypothetical protein
VAEEQGTQDIVKAMVTHSANAALLESACAALWTLSVEGILCIHGIVMYAD